ncbi:MAG: hypothetical protein IPH36_17430 [Saprospiraceae bacterium]|nr:hypothetical protein [Saprospiraceae bacterium]
MGIKIFLDAMSLILPIFEGLRLLNSTDQDFDRKYNKGLYVQRRDSGIERGRARANAQV